MLSNTDIKKELGKNINIYPFKVDNIKENSINLCTSKYAWSTTGGTIYYNAKLKIFSDKKENNNDKRFIISKGGTCVVSFNNKKKIILLPKSTTLIETLEVIAVGSNIGGTYHSKVGMVSQGLGHIGTMLGPNFSGHSLIAIHNLTDRVIDLSVGESFVSVVFHYLDTPITNSNPTVSGHIDKFSELGIAIQPEEREEITKDWKLNISKVKDKMLSSDEFINFYNEEKKKKSKSLSSIINKNNMIFLLILLIVLSIVIGGGYLLDAKYGNTDWSNRAWNIVGSGVFVTIIGTVLKKFKI